MTGMHTIADVSCERCAAVLGWKYVRLVRRLNVCRRE
jgi:hypothetical protein